MSDNSVDRGGGDEAGFGRRFLRAARMASPITLGLDGRPREADDPLSGIVGGTEEETVEAANIVEEAQRRADELIRRATSDAQAIRDRAREQGYEAGYAEGARTARVELAEALRLVQQVASEGQAIRNDVLRRNEREMVEMVIQALDAILGERAVDDPSIVIRTVRHALDRAGAQNVVRVRVHPDEAVRVVTELTDAKGEPPSFEVFPDGSVGIGGCVVDTEHGRVDARLDVQLDAVARLLRDALPVEPGEPEILEATGAA